MQPHISSSWALFPGVPAGRCLQVSAQQATTVIEDIVVQVYHGELTQWPL
jgi:hypothetical protein